MRAAVALLALGGFAACSPSPTVKAGGESEPTVLRMTAPERNGQPAVEHFARAAHEASGGTLVIEVDWPTNLEITVEGEARVIEEVRTGQTDLAQAPARTFDRVGIHRFAALQDPLTLDSLTAADAVARSPLVEQMLADLADDGLIGLGVYVENLRRPVGYRGALRHADDFAGVNIRAQPSELTYRMLIELGAIPAMSRGYVASDTGARFVAAESTWQAWDEEDMLPFPRGATVTANLVFFPKVNVFIANADTFASLTEEQQGALREAAYEAREAWASSYRADDYSMAERWCADGFLVAMASPGDLQSVRQALRPMIAELEADPVIGPDLHTVRQIAADTAAAPFEVPPWCQPRTGDGARLDR